MKSVQLKEKDLALLRELVSDGIQKTAEAQAATFASAPMMNWDEYACEMDILDQQMAHLYTLMEKL